MAENKAIQAGEKLPGRSYTPDNVQLFFYNAALWNAHRIHFDFPYATEVEGYPGLVIAGPLLGDWLTQCVIDWLGDRGVIEEIEYSNRIASYIGETLRSEGKILEVDDENGRARIEVGILNEQDQVVAPGTITVRFHKD